MSEDLKDILGFDLETASEFEEPKKPKQHYLANSDFRDIEKFTDRKRIVTWLNQTRHFTLDALDEIMVDQTYALALWLFRASAIDGDLKAVKAMEAWLTWAKPIIGRPKQVKAPEPSRGSVAFMPREPEKEENE